MAKFARDEPISVHIADATLTASTPGTGADGTTWTGAQCTAAYTDIAALITKLNAILVILESAGLNKTA